MRYKKKPARRRQAILFIKDLYKLIRLQNHIIYIKDIPFKKNEKDSIILLPDMITEDQKLDNPVWYALHEEHKKYALSYQQIKFYNPAYCPFGAFSNIENTCKGIAQYALLTNDFYVVGDKPIIPSSIILKKELVCEQMILSHPINLQITEEIVPLLHQQKQDLFDLVDLVQPGYFRKDTADLGSYFGIYKNNKLIAAAGERMKLNTFTEVSAIVTHPNFTGNGYAKQLIAHTCNNIFKQGKTPFLHVSDQNMGAINLYKKLAFNTRRKISFWNLGF